MMTQDMNQNGIGPPPQLGANTIDYVNVTQLCIRKLSVVCLSPCVEGTPSSSC